MARTLNLIVAPASAVAASAAEDALEGLGAHSPSRTLVLRRHGADRLDAELVIESEVPEAAGRVGVSHDRVTLTADDSRLEHAASLLAPLLLSDLPTVLWLPEPDSPIPDRGLLDRAQQILVDSTARRRLRPPPPGRVDAERPGPRPRLGAAGVLAGGHRRGLRAPRAASPAAPGGAPRRPLRGRCPVGRAALGRVGGGARGLAPGGARARRRASEGEGGATRRWPGGGVADARPRSAWMRGDREADLPNRYGRGEDRARRRHQPASGSVRRGTAADSVVCAGVSRGPRSGHRDARACRGASASSEARRRSRRRGRRGRRPSPRAGCRRRRGACPSPRRSSPRRAHRAASRCLRR